MAGTFLKGETKVRPSAYFRVEKVGGTQIVGADDGTVCVLFAADYGPLGEATELTSTDDYTLTYGNAGTTKMLSEVLQAGPKAVVAIRLGSAGTMASVSLTNASEGDGAVINAKYAGSKSFSVTIRDKASDDNYRECIIYSGGGTFESYDFVKGGDEAAALATAMQDSPNFKCTAKGSGTLTAVTAKAFTAGTDPEITTQSYSDALGVAEKYRFNTICVDTEKSEVHLLLAAFLDRIYNLGQFAIGVVAEDPSKSLSDRESVAAAYNSEKMVYVLNADVMEAQTEVKGCYVAARIASMIAVCESNTSLTHTVISGFSDLAQKLTPSQITTAETKGCLVLSLNPSGQVWIDYAINTLITPDDNHDEGWKKIRRVKTRYELMYRCNTTADALIGKVDNDKNGRATVISQMQTIINAMINEGKLTSGTVSEDDSMTSDVDSAYFIIDVIDKDSIEHLYITYKFRFSTIAE